MKAQLSIWFKGLLVSLPWQGPSSGIGRGLRASMSLGRRRGYSRASARYAECPLWNSRIEVSHGMVAPSSSSWGAQVCYYRHTSVSIGSSLLSTEEACLSLAFLGCFDPFEGTTSPSSTSCTFLFFFKSGQGSGSTVVIGRGGGRLAETWDLGISLDNPPLFLLVRRPFSPFLGLISISSSSSELGSIQATMSLREWAAECLSKSSSEFGSWIIGSAHSSLSFSKWNWSISTSSDRCEESVSSLGIATLGRMR